MAKKQSKKIIRTKISNRLVQTFGDLESVLGKKKFRRNIKKASKALALQVKDLGLEAEVEPEIDNINAEETSQPFQGNSIAF